MEVCFVLVLKANVDDINVKILIIMTKDIFGKLFGDR